MPDRDALLDEANAKERIALAVNSIWKRFLESEKLRLSGEQFAETYWQIASKVEGSFTLMNDVEWLPSTSLEVISDYPITRSESDCNYWSRSKSGVSKEAITSGAITLFDNDFYERDEGDHFAKLLWAKDTDAVFLSGHLPEGHWAKNHVVSLQQVDAEISFKEIKQTNWDGHYACGNVILVNSLSVTILGKTQYLQEPFVRYGTYSDFIVPEDALEPFWVLRQASSYTDGNDNYAELEHELDIEDFSAMVAILKGEDSEVTLIRLLKDARLFSNLNDRAFLVSFGKDGKVTVTPQ